MTTYLRVVSDNPTLASPSGGDGGGPEDPMLEQRVGKLEEKVDRIEAAVLRIDGMVTQILEASAKQAADILEIKGSGAKQADLHKLQLDVVELKATSAKQADLTRVQADVAEIKGRLAGIEGRIGSVEGRFNQVPTIWNMFALIVTLLIGMAGLMFTAGKFLHP